METRELTDMTAVLRSINGGNPSNAERWVTLTQRVVRAETRANAAERAAPARIGKSRTPNTTAGSPTTAPRLPSRKPPKRRTKPPAGKCLP